MLVTNDPYPSGVHLNDVIAHRARPRARASCSGTSPTSRTTWTSAAARRRAIGAFREVFQEGVIIPPVKLVTGGRIVDDVFRLILAQIRSKRETAGDFRAQVAANTTGTRRIQALVGRHGRATVRATMARARSTTPSGGRGRSSRRCRTASTRPRASVDTDGFTDEPVHLRARSSIRRDGVLFDPTGSDPQRRAPVNSTFAQTFSACAYALKCLIDPDLPVNDGFYRLLEVHAPQGTVTNCTLAGAGRRRLGDADAARRDPLPRAAARASRSGSRRGRRG